MRCLPLFLALLHAIPQDDPARQARLWVEKLRSDMIEERDDAARHLRALGKAAVPELERVAKDLDLARHLLKVIALAQSIPEIAKRYPGAEERLITAGPRGWTELFLKIWDREKKEDPSLATLPAPERAMLVSRAFPGARDVEEGLKLLDVARNYKIVDAIPEIAKVLEAKDEGCHHLALATLGELGGPAAVPLLIAGLKEPRAELRATAVQGLRRNGGKESVQAVLSALNDPSSGVRHEAVQVLGWREAKEAVPALIRRLGDEEPSVRIDALVVLDRLGATEAIEEIKERLKDPSVPVCLGAASALCGLGSRDGVALFLEKTPGSAGAELSYLLENTKYTWTFRAPDYDVLNGARQPKIWRRLKETKFGSAAFKGTHRQALEKAAKDGGLAIDIRATVSDETQQWLSSDYSGWYDWMPDTLLRVLEKARYVRLRFVLEADRIRFITPEEEPEFWNRWWREEGKK